MGDSCRVRVVSRLRIAPVKGLASVSVPTVRLDVDGVAEDRRLFLLRENESVVTMRRFPLLTGVVPDLDLAAAKLGLTFPDGSSTTADLTSLGGTAGGLLFGKQRSGRVVIGPASDALSDLVGERLRLVLAGGTGVGWDEGPVSLIGSASARSATAPSDPGGDDSARYRMLVEVSGTAAFEEDDWVGRRLRLGRAEVRVTHCLGRCAVIAYQASTGARDWDGVRSLAALRGRPTLGVIAEVTLPGLVGEGDQVEVLTYQSVT